MRISIIRFGKYPKEILGLLYINELPRFVTIENPKYLIPAGTYKAVKDWHYGENIKSKYKCWELINVKNRSQIQIHIANLAREIKGCFGIGYKFGELCGENAVLESYLAYKDFMDRTIQQDELTIEITEKF